MNIFKYFLFVLVFAVLAVSAGCNQQNQNSSQVSSAEKATNNTEKVVTLPLESKPLPPIPVDQEAVEKLPNTNGPTYQKPGASVRFSHNYGGASDVGISEVVTLSFNHAYSAGTLSIQLEAQDGLELADNQSPYTFALDGSKTVEIEALLTAAVEGKYYLSIFATVDKPGSNPISRVFALAFNVGDLSQTAKSALEPIHMSVEKTAADEKLIMMPAEETISQ